MTVQVVDADRVNQLTDTPLAIQKIGTIPAGEYAVPASNLLYSAPRKLRGDTMEDITAACASIDWPAWVQAIGSVLAILAAVEISRRQFRHAERLTRSQWDREERVRSIRARSLALAIYPELWEMKAKIARAGTFDPLQCISIPPVLIESVDRLYLLDAAGGDIQQFLAFVRQYNRMAEEVIGMPHGEKQIESLTHHLNVADTALAQALEKIVPIHDGVG
jgi:hypothetical protein